MTPERLPTQGGRGLAARLLSHAPAVFLYSAAGHGARAAMETDPQTVASNASLGAAMCVVWLVLRTQRDFDFPPVVAYPLLALQIGMAIDASLNMLVAIMLLVSRLAA